MYEIPFAYGSRTCDHTSKIRPILEYASQFGVAYQDTSKMKWERYRREVHVY